MFDFLKTVKAAEDFSLKFEIHKRVPGVEPPRPHFPLRASDLLKDDYAFCPREHAFLDMGVASKKGSYVGTALRLTYNHGHYMEDQIRNDLVRDLAVGTWECEVCGHEHPSFGHAPKVKCPSCGWGHKWKYKEVRFEDKYTGVSGGIDLLVKTPKPKLMIIEIKTMAPDKFKDLVAPLAEHRARTTLYMHLASKTKLAERVNLNEARVIYAVKSYGIKDETLATNGIKDSPFSPFKEFPLTRDDTILNTPLARARTLKVWRDTKKGIPCGICPNGLVKRAQQCSAVSACFSGKYPSTLTWPELGAPKHPGKTLIE